MLARLRANQNRDVLTSSGNAEIGVSSSGSAPAAILFGVFFIAPLCLIVVYSFWETKNYELVPAFTTKNYHTIITTSTYVKTFAQDGVDGVFGHDHHAGTGVPVLLLAGALCAQEIAAGAVPSGDPAVLDQLSAAGVRLGGDPGRQRRDQLAAQGRWV